MTAPGTARHRPAGAVPITSILPKLASRPQPSEDVAGGEMGTVIFISEWLTRHFDNSCTACEGLGFCLRCDARGCDECHGGLCERCSGVGLQLDRDLFRGEFSSF